MYVIHEVKEVDAKYEGLRYLCLLNIISICVTLVSVVSAFYKIVVLHKNKVHLPLGGKLSPVLRHLSHHILYYPGPPYAVLRLSCAHQNLNVFQVS